MNAAEKKTQQLQQRRTPAVNRATYSDAPDGAIGIGVRLYTNTALYMKLSARANCAGINIEEAALRILEEHA